MAGLNVMLFAVAAEMLARFTPEYASAPGMPRL